MQQPNRMIKRIMIPDIRWIEIPAGDFLYGEKNETRHLERFFISKFPITNAQYQTFVDDVGYDDKRWWDGLEKTDYQISRWPQSNRPKTDVSWFEAIAFTR